MTMWVKVGSTWEEATPDAKHSGSWGLTALWAKASGTWQKIWPTYVVTLSGESVSHLVDPPTTARAGIRVNSDGTIDKSTTSTPVYTQIDSGTDWIIPNSASGDATYHVRVSGGSGDAFAVGSDAEGSWIAVSTNPEWWVISAGPESLISRTFTLSISDDGGTTTLDSATYTVTAEVNPL